MTLTDPRIRLVIDQSLKNPDAPSTTPIWNLGDTLCGHLELSSKNELDILEISIYLEGFLSQVRNIVSADISRTEASLDQCMYEAAFHFNIPKSMPRLKPDLPEHCLQLPPSLELGEILVDGITGKGFAQPSIRYSLRPLGILNNREEDGGKTIETTLPIIMAPYTEEFPPTNTKDFPAEFKEQDSKVVRRHLMAGSFGELTISIREPPALQFEAQAVRATTSISAKLEFNSQSSSQVYQTLQGLSFTIFSLIRIKTFYSLETFPRLPSQNLLTLHGTTRMREMIKLETRTLRDVSWKYIYEFDNPVEGIIFFRSLLYLISFIFNLRKETDERVMQPVMQLLTSPPQGKWTATLNIPIQPDIRLLPTFCTSVVARLYTIIVRVKVKGAGSTESFDLETPLQVIYSSPKAQPPVYDENFGQETLYEQFRGVAEKSWFSEESMKSAQDPPGYYP